MTTRRDWLLQQLGIVRWTLRQPSVLQGEVAITLPWYIRLLLVAEEPPLYHPLVADVARSMMLTPTQLYGITPLQVKMLPNNVCCHCWWIGLDALREFEGVSFHTPSLVALSADVSAKRELWRQISSDNVYHITVAADLYHRSLAHKTG